MRIGELARAAGVTPRTVRYYEEIGLLPESTSRPAGSHREYGEDDLRRIVSIQFEALRDRLAQRRIELEITDAAEALLAREGFDAAYGARPLKRVIQREVGDHLAIEILEGRVADGTTVTIDADGDDIVIRS